VKRNLRFVLPFQKPVFEHFPLRVYRTATSQCTPPGAAQTRKDRPEAVLLSEKL
jgi:hypothetical protein